MPVAWSCCSGDGKPKVDRRLLPMAMSCFSKSRRAQLYMASVKSICNSGFCFRTWFKKSSAKLSLWVFQSWSGSVSAQNWSMIANSCLSCVGIWVAAASSSVLFQCSSSSRRPWRRQASLYLGQMWSSNRSKSWKEVGPVTVWRSSLKKKHSCWLGLTVYTRPMVPLAFTPGSTCAPSLRLFHCLFLPKV